MTAIAPSDAGIATLGAEGYIYFAFQVTSSKIYLVHSPPARLPNYRWENPSLVEVTVHGAIAALPTLPLAT